MTTVDAPRGAALNATWQDAPTRTISAGGVEFAYRQLGPSTGVPVVFLTHLAAVLDNWDPRVVDGFAAEQRVITFDNRGVGASSGATPTTIEEMASDAVDLHPRPRLGSGRPVRVLDGRHDRPGNRARAAAARAQDDHRRNRPRGRRRHRQGDPHLIPGHRARTAHAPGPQAVPLLHQDAERPPSREGVPGTARGTYERPRQGHLRALVPRPAQGHPPLGSAGARGPLGYPPAGARHERRERQDGADQEHRRARPTTPEQPACRLSRRRARRGVPVPRGLRRAGARVPREGKS